MVVKKKTTNSVVGRVRPTLVLVYGAINTDDDQMRGATPGRPDIWYGAICTLSLSLVWCHLLCKIRFSRISYI